MAYVYRYEDDSCNELDSSAPGLSFRQNRCDGKVSGEFQLRYTALCDASAQSQSCANPFGSDGLPDAEEPTAPTVPAALEPKVLEISFAAEMPIAGTDTYTDWVSKFQEDTAALLGISASRINVRGVR